jgi:predicted alpha/beta superfamily hydrolase
LLCLLSLSVLVAQERPQLQPAPVPNPPASSSSPEQEQPAAPDANQIIAHEHSVTDMLDVVPFTSKIFHNTRMLRVFLPGNYFSPRNRQRQYPVLYLQDGQNVFDKATSFTGREWEADETVDHLVSEFKIHPMFIIGIDSAPDPHQRAVEYLPYPDTLNPHSPSAQDLRGKDYARFVVTEVMPFIEKHYRVATGTASTAIGGSSYGATAALYTALHNPRTFGKVLLESPILEVGNGQLLHEAQELKTPPSKMYIGVGTSDGWDAETSERFVKDVQQLEKVLRAKGMGPTRLKVVIDSGAEHGEDAWARRLPEALLFLYRR